MAALQLSLRLTARRAPRSSFRLLSSTAQITESVDEEIIVPRRIPRGPTTILDALSNNVKKDYLAPNYKYVDDPFLIPSSNLEKKIYSLSKASGTKAAKFVMEQHPEYFKVNPTDPMSEFAEGFQLRLISTPDNTLDGLQQRIDLRKPFEAFECYQKVKLEGGTVNDGLREQLLALLCITNSANNVDMEEDEVFFRTDKAGQNKTEGVKFGTKTWQDHGPAEQVFKDIAEPSADAYNTIVRGRAKYLQIDKARETYQKMLEDGIPVSLETYCAIIDISNYIHNKTEVRWSFILDVMNTMQKQGVVPDIRVFDSVLYSLTKNIRYMKTPIFCNMVLKEMELLEIEPSLSSWTSVIRIFYPSEDSDNPTLHKILEKLKGKELVLKEPKDMDFFFLAMTKCFNMKDLELAHKIDELLLVGKNFELLGDSYRIGVYYTYLMRMYCMFEQIDTIMEQYDKICPHTYTPTFLAMYEILQAIELNDGHHYLPRLWSDFVLYEYTNRADLIQQLLQLAAAKKHDLSLQQQLLTIADGVWDKFESDAASTWKTMPLQLSGPAFGYLIEIYLNGDRFDSAWEFFTKYKTNRNKIDGFPTEQAVVNLTEACIEKQSNKQVFQCLQLLADCAYPKLDEMCARATKRLQLTTSEREEIDDLL